MSKSSASLSEAGGRDTPDRRYWFKAKRWGWGWGRPCSWEGWVISIGYLAAVLGSSALGPARRPLTLAVVVAATALLLWACVAKGEPPRWRWGSVEIYADAVEPPPERPAVVRPVPEPFKSGDPRDAVRAELHRRMSQSAGIDPWDYLDSVVRGEQLIVRLREDDGRLAIIEVELPDPVTPDDWDLLDVWIDEFMWTGRSAPISTTDTETTYRFEQQTDPLRQRRVWPIIACCAALCITTVVLFWANYPLLGSVTLLATAALAVYVKYTRIWPD